ncbi:MAG: 50S ribosomal protein L18 [Bacilli bacterium]
MITKKSKNKIRKVRHYRIRKNMHGTDSCPRLVVYRSNANMYAQLIDDDAQKTICSASTIDKELKLENGSTIEAAKKVGALIGKRAVEKKIVSVIFDRSGYLYHGRIQALADAAREAGLKF